VLRKRPHAALVAPAGCRSVVRNVHDSEKGAPSGKREKVAVRRSSDGNTGTGPPGAAQQPGVGQEDDHSAACPAGKDRPPVGCGLGAQRDVRDHEQRHGEQRQPGAGAAHLAGRVATRAGSHLVMLPGRRRSRTRYRDRDEDTTCATDAIPVGAPGPLWAVRGGSAAGPPAAGVAGVQRGAQPWTTGVARGRRGPPDRQGNQSRDQQLDADQGAGKQPVADRCQNDRYSGDGQDVGGDQRPGDRPPAAQRQCCRPTRRAHPIHPPSAGRPLAVDGLGTYPRLAPGPQAISVAKPANGGGRDGD